MIHWRREKWEREPKQAPQYGIRGERRGRENSIAIDEVIRNRQIHNHHAYAYAYESKTASAFGPVSLFLINDGEGAEEHIESTVDDGHVYRE